MSKRVLITGIGGAIGAHVMVHLLANTDWEIEGLDSFRHKGQYDRITRFCRDHPDWPARIRIEAHDLCAELTDRQVGRLGQIDYIINLASRSDVHASVEDRVSFVRNNVELMVNVLELTYKIKPERLLHFSTDEVYGPAPPDGTGHKEGEAHRPSNPYSGSKSCQEQLAFCWWRSLSVPIQIVNSMNHFAEGQSPSKYSAMIQQKVAKGETVTVHAAADGQIGTRYYIHSRNAADALLFILNNTTPTMHQPGEIDDLDRFNIVGDRQVDNLQFAQIIADMMGEPLRHELVNFHGTQPGHDLHYGLDGSKLARLGWRSPLGFEESLRNTIDWQQRNPEWLN